ncbi:3'-5' exonuclease [Pedobacter aquae]|uniref:3'-5' exonuclease n=1 Tax=Pedobacter aquae TaxID=2605747 RepID=A0A5C0VEE1_9SPHI|nr:3'-5' exonuclease [Pedobacter aquae]QEK51045.1 3'-5' exonuclease [Pedobacter aquae]
MKDYLLFIDTETSGLPKKWDKPYQDTDNWPTCIQLAWIIYHKSGEEVKRENFYMKLQDLKIEDSAFKIHGITPTFLEENGIKRKQVLQKFAYDVKKYNPLLIAHFMELDFHIVGVDAYRAKLKNPIENSPLFCTMLASSKYVHNPTVNFLRLGELYHFLFDEKMEQQHHALKDAEATAACFFEMLKRGDITAEQMETQQFNFKMKQPKAKSKSIWPFSMF